MSLNRRLYSLRFYSDVALRHGGGAVLQEALDQGNVIAIRLGGRRWDGSFVLPPQALHRFMREICLGTIRQRKAAGGWALERDAVGCVNPECFGRRHSHAPVWKTGRRQQTRPFVSCAIRLKNRPHVFRQYHQERIENAYADIDHLVATGKHLECVQPEFAPETA